MSGMLFHCAASASITSKSITTFFASGVIDRVFPAKDEYSQLNKVDDRLNVFKFSDSVGKKFSSSSNGAMNRFFESEVT